MSGSQFYRMISAISFLKAILFMTGSLEETHEETHDEQNFTAAYKPKADAYKPKADAYKPKANAYKPKADAYKPKADACWPNEHVGTLTPYVITNNTLC